MVSWNSKAEKNISEESAGVALSNFEYSAYKKPMRRRDWSTQKCANCVIVDANASGSRSF